MSRLTSGNGGKRDPVMEETLSQSTDLKPQPEEAPKADLAGADLLTRGATVGRYLVLERLGAGAMGIVYGAYDPELDRKIALKLLRPTKQRAGDQMRWRWPSESVAPCSSWRPTMRCRTWTIPGPNGRIGIVRTRAFLSAARTIRWCLSRGLTR